MTEIIKTEKWSSLRLDLQQFSPQEFVAACYWQITLTCSHSNWNIYENSVNKTDLDHGSPHTKTLTAYSNDEKSSYNTNYKIGTSIKAGSNWGHATQAKGWYDYDNSNYHVLDSGEWRRMNLS
ncbi:MAG: hypothetical protein Q4D30_00695 [Bacteroidales bacterium]|nr:hypothetical protein [Bacteroidales bacterium]